MLEIVLNAIPSCGFRKVVHIVIGFPRAKKRKERHGLTEK
jgi:hypothetical protein